MSETSDLVDHATTPSAVEVEPLTDGGVALEYDTTGDGLPDLFVESLRDGSLVAVADDDGDLLPDVLGVDLDGDGDYEVLVTRVGDLYRVQVDQDGDGLFEHDAEMTRADVWEVDPGIVEMLDRQLGGPEALDPADGAGPYDESPYVVDGQLVGDPVGDAEHWFQQAVNGFCVPASIAQIVSEYTGVHHADELHFVDRANDLKVFTVGPDGVPGMSVDGALTLLEDAGIPASLEYGDGIETLVEYLEEGRRVMVAVDSGEIWGVEAVEDNAMDHAIVVTGVDLERGVVIVSDPGDPEGNAKEYPLDVFVDAWADSSYAAVVCDVTPEEFAAGTPAVESAADVEANEQQATVVAQPGAASLPFGGVEPGAADAGGRSPLEVAAEWTVAHPWVVLPVVLGASHVLRSRSR